MTITAADRAWNSPTTLYLARKLSSLSANRTLAVLDLGCGDGTVLEQLVQHGHDLFGCDLPDRRAALQKRLVPLFGEAFERHIRTVADEQTIPFDDGSFDIIYANQVFEHVRNLDMMLRECARVLRNEGVLLTTFPPATCPMEVHLGIPLAHWLPSGSIRTRYLQLFYGLGLRPRLEGCSSKETAQKQDDYLREQTFYRTAGKTVALTTPYFGSAACETKHLIEAKLDMMAKGASPAMKLVSRVGRVLNGKLLSYLVTRLSIAAYSFKKPKKHHRHH